MIDLMQYTRRVTPIVSIENKLKAWKAGTGSREVVASYGIGGFAGLRKHHLVREMQAKVLDSREVYPAAEGEASLHKAIVWSHNQDSDGRVKLGLTEVSVAYGARGALMVTMEALAQIFGPLAAVILMDPGYGGTYWAIKRAGLTPVLVQCGLGANYCEGALRKIEELRRAGITLAAVIWEPVHNPTGTLGTAEELVLLGRATHKAGAVFLGDEVYLPFVYSGEPCPSVLEKFNHKKVPVLAIRSASKVHANSQDRIGDIAGTQSLIGRYIDTQAVINYGPPLVVQEGYKVALRDCRSSVPAIVRLIEQHSVIIYKGFNEVGWHPGKRPSAGMFGLAKMPLGYNSAMEFCLHATTVGLRFWPLDAFCRPESSAELIEKAQGLIRLPFVETLDGMKRSFVALRKLFSGSVPD